MAWAILILSAVLEAVWATALGLSDGLSRGMATAIFLVAFAAALFVQALCSTYYLLFFSVFLALWMLWFVRLREWRALPAYVYMRCEGGATVRPTVDPAQIDEHRISAVQYLKFHLDDWRPIALGCDLPGLIAETTLVREQRDALNDDLRSTAEFASATPGVGTAAQTVVAIHQDRGDNHRRQT